MYCSVLFQFSARSAAFLKFVLKFTCLVADCHALTEVVSKQDIVDPADHIPPVCKIPAVMKFSALQALGNHSDEK